MTAKTKTSTDSGDLGIAEERVYGDPVRSQFAPGPKRAKDLDACDVSGKLRAIRICATLDKETDTVVLGTLPAGHSLFLGHLSLITVSSVPEKAEGSKTEPTFSLGLGAHEIPMGPRVNLDRESLVANKTLREVQTLLGNLDNAKLRCVSGTDVILTTSVPLASGVVVSGVLIYAYD